MANQPQAGSLNTEFYLHLAWIPQIITEWAALIPLILHLAAPNYDYKLAGRACLSQRLTIGLFPRLGTAASIARFLDRGNDFLDRTATDGKSSLQVWDVMWGSVFPCVNGAASSILAKEAMKNRIGANATRSSSQASTRQTTKRGESPELEFRRPQTLNIFLCSRNVRKVSILTEIDNILLDHGASLLSATIFLAGGTALLCLFGLFGTAAATAIGLVSKVACRFVLLYRTPRFLDSTEKPQNTHRNDMDGAMLVAVHNNASNWHLYVGDRGVIDALLNKPMIQLRTCPTVLRYWFKIADLLQLLAMTFAAAQKGWDGVAMVILMVLDWVAEFLRHRDGLIARRFLASKNVEMTNLSLQFKGRVSMLLAIQVCSGSQRAAWIDNIIVPAPRLEVLLDRLGIRSANAQNQTTHGFASLSPADQEWVTNNEEWALAEAQRLRVVFDKMTDVP